MKLEIIYLVVGQQVQQICIVFLW